MGLDYYGIAIEGTLALRDGKPYKLWVGGTDLPGALANPAWVSNITIELALGLNSKVQVTLTPPFEEGLELINSDLLEWGMGNLLVSVGYTTGSGETMTKPFGGLIQKPDFKIGTDISVTLTALGVGYSLNLKKPIGPRKWDNKSPAEVVLEVLKNYQELDISDIYSDFTIEQKSANLREGKHPFFRIPTKLVPEGTGPQAKQKAELITIEQSTKNDWWFFTDLVRKHALDVKIINKKVTLHEPTKWRADKPVMSFILRGPIDSEKRQYPILELDSPDTWIWLAVGAGKAVAADVKFQKQIGIFQATPAKPTTETTTKPEPGRKQPKVKTEQIEITQGMPGGVYASEDQNAAFSYPACPEDGRDEEIKAELKNIFNQQGVILEITTIGIPDLLPGQVVTIHGTGGGSDKPKFDANYGVQWVQHQCGTAGYVTKFKAINSMFPHHFTAGQNSATMVNAGKPVGSGGDGQPGTVTMQANGE